MPNTQQLKTWIALIPALASLAAGAAEIRGTVSVQQGDRFGAAGGALEALPVSVALYPAEGQPLPAGGRASLHELNVAGNRIQPLYLAVRRGDRVRFRSHDGIFHELFSHSRAQPFEVRLDRSGAGGSVLTLAEASELHWFCRIHAKSYARIDVLDTPLVSMLPADGRFEFRDLAPGMWRLRIAAPGAETRILEATAMTAPPPLQVELAVKGFGLGLQTPQNVTVNDLFPARPGP
ncbi:MAG: carboxypeptidase regulatory-like domain-containing protein [Gammaproteobacteria bacterium]